MDHAAYLRKVAVQLQVRVKIRRGLQLAFQNFSVQVAKNHILWCQLFVCNTAGLDGNNAGLPVDATGIAESIKNQPAPDYLEVGFENLGLQTREVHEFLHGAQVGCFSCSV
jgi:hypothetical protein